MTNFSDNLYKFEIDESVGALGIVLGYSNVDNVIEIMGSPDEKGRRNEYYYNDLGVIVYFDENNIVKSMSFLLPYWGQTTKGLSLGDSFEKAIQLYGYPGITHNNYSFWGNLGIVYDHENKISEIRIGKP